MVLMYTIPFCLWIIMHNGNIWEEDREGVIAPSTKKVIDFRK